MVYWKLTFIDSYHPRFRRLTWLWSQQDPISRQWPTINRSGGWWWCTGNNIIHKLHIVYTLKTGNKCVESNDDNIIINLVCVLFICSPCQGFQDTGRVWRRGATIQCFGGEISQPYCHPLCCQVTSHTITCKSLFCRLHIYIYLIFCVYIACCFLFSMLDSRGYVTTVTGSNLCHTFPLVVSWL